MTNQHAERLMEQINDLKRRKNAVILAHNYQPIEVQAAADITGDSLGLSIEAARTRADLIVFCGVRFMAESAKILSPGKKVLLPRREAGCPMADMITPEQARRMKAEHPGAPLVMYVNSSAAVKAECDICCTSGNVLKVVRSLPESTILMAPDRNLANYAKRMIPEKEYVIHDGFCPTHEIMRADDILAARAEHPEAVVIAHPECRAEVLDLADEVSSTSGMITFCANSPATEFIIGTEITMIDVLAKKYPAKRFYPALIFSSCGNMRMTRLQDLAEALEQEQHEIILDETIRSRAYRSVKRMIEMA